MTVPEFIDAALKHHKKEYPFNSSNSNRERYYWLSGFLHDVRIGAEKIEPQKPEPNRAKSIDDIDMSIRLYNLLKNNKVLTVGDIIDLSASPAFKPPHRGGKWRGSGDTTYNELIEVMAGLGVTWPAK
jgi:DNA-directed RNA polymerase alpha subunit